MLNKKTDRGSYPAREKIYHSAARSGDPEEAEED
jgi:hypothetical protein